MLGRVCWVILAAEHRDGGLRSAIGQQQDHAHTCRRLIAAPGRERFSLLFVSSADIDPSNSQTSDLAVPASTCASIFSIGGAQAIKPCTGADQWLSDCAAAVSQLPPAVKELLPLSCRGTPSSVAALCTGAPVLAGAARGLGSADAAPKQLRSSRGCPSCAYTHGSQMISFDTVLADLDQSRGLSQSARGRGGGV